MQAAVFEDHVFRYRSTEALLAKFDELEQQSIYFSPPHQLNDPMEGTRPIIWRGDPITWRNLLRHYVSCLHNGFLESLFAGDDAQLTASSISVFYDLDSCPTPDARALLGACQYAVEALDSFGAFLDCLVSQDRAVSRAELSSLLSMVHLDWLQAIRQTFFERGLCSAPMPPPYRRPDIALFFDSHKRSSPALQKQFGEQGLELAGNIAYHAIYQANLSAAYMAPDKARRVGPALLFDFPDEYLKSLERLMYPPWFVACFSTRHDNPAMWSYYAQNHDGCCLIFKPKTDGTKRTLSLSGVKGDPATAIWRGKQQFELEAVEYRSELPPVEFFSNIGRLPFDRLMTNWFRGREGDVSLLARHFANDKQDEWRKAYWDTYIPALLRKLPDWQHESEVRIIIPDNLSFDTTEAGRIFRYELDELDGLIFGMNVSTVDKLTIMERLDRKLTSTTRDRPFALFQARYNDRTGKVEAYPLKVLSAGHG